MSLLTRFYGPRSCAGQQNCAGQSLRISMSLLTRLHVLSLFGEADAYSLVDGV